MLEEFRGKRVLITGHTGFKGAWLTLWLKLLGAEIIGVALDPVYEKGAFNAMRVSSLCTDIRQDINDLNAVKKIFKEYQPEIVFHLAAQPLVLDSYERPVETFQTNVIGTVNILESCRFVKSIRAIVIITSDKCYENLEINKGYKETDKLGGKDPYSASKAAAELVVNAYRESFFQKDTGIGIATARAGNVIGGGDWATNRIVPDCIKALLANQALNIRNPDAVRPWQYVLEPLRGYLMLAEKLLTNPLFFSGPWNFGPGEKSKLTVSELVSAVFKTWNTETSKTLPPSNQSPNQSISQSYREAHLLSLDITKARKYLNWHPNHPIIQSVNLTVNWYKAQSNGEDMQNYSIKEIYEYQKLFR